MMIGWYDARASHDIRHCKKNEYVRRHSISSAEQQQLPCQVNKTLSDKIKKIAKELNYIANMLGRQL